MFKIIFIKLRNVTSICIREVLDKHFRNIRYVRKTFRKNASSPMCIRKTPNGHDERFRNPFISVRRVLKAFGKHTESEVIMREVLGLFLKYIGNIRRANEIQTETIR